MAELWAVYPIENSDNWENCLSLWLNVCCVPLLKTVKIVKIRKWFWFVPSVGAYGLGLGSVPLVKIVENVRACAWSASCARVPPLKIV